MFIIVPGKLTAAYVNVKSALQLLAMLVWKPMKTNYIEVEINRTLGVIGSEGFNLQNVFSNELAPIPTSL